MSSTYDAATNIEEYNRILDALAKDLFYKETGKERTVEIKDTKLRKGAWISSILSNSDSDKHKEKALAFSVLSFLYKSGTEQEELYKRFLYLQLSRLGSLPATISFIDGSEISFIRWVREGSNPLLMDELSGTRRQYQIDDDSVLSEFQLRIWNKLDEKFLVISGPTSSGKSHVMQEYLRRSITGKFQGVYIVPNRALISQASGGLRNKLDDVEVLTGAYIDDVKSDNFLLVLTPERCLSLLEYHDDDDVDIDFVFIDEIQNIESDSRGPLFENVLESIREFWPNAKIIGAGPYINNPREIFKEILNIDPEGVESKFTPAYHMVLSMVLKKGSSEIDVLLESPSGRTLIEGLERPTGLTYTGISQRSSKAIAKAVNEFGGESQNLVYANTKLRAENWASEIAKGRSREIEEPRVYELIKFLSSSIHQDYSLVASLRKGVAFHHSGVPKVAREEIENLYKEEVIDTVVSTSTLLEGVNLPAEKMFIVEAKVSDKDLSNFDYQNLIGRVGRMSSKMYGSIILLAAEDDDWTRWRRSGGSRKDVTPTTNRVFEQMGQELRNHIDDPDIRNMPNRSLQYTIAILRNKYLKDDHDLAEYLQRKGLEEGDIEDLKEKLSEVTEGVSIPIEVLRRNPTVDPVLQDHLFKQVTNDPGRWTIKPQNLQQGFFRVTRQLNRIFLFVDDSYENNFLTDDMEAETDETELIRILFPAYFWLRGDNYQNIIMNRYREVGMETTIDATIKKVLSIINTDVRFVLVKYYKILCDILDEVESYDNKFMLNFDKRLERGAFQPRTLELMDLGVDRAIAINLDPPEEGQEQYLKDIAGEQTTLVRSHLESLGLID